MFNFIKKLFQKDYSKIAKKAVSNFKIDLKRKEQEEEKFNKNFRDKTLSNFINKSVKKRIKNVQLWLLKLSGLNYL